MSTKQVSLKWSIKRINLIWLIPVSYTHLKTSYEQLCAIMAEHDLQLAKKEAGLK